VIVDQIHTYLKDLGDRVRTNQIPLAQFIITKALTKNPEDYPDKKNLSHVAVALRYNETNKSGKKLRGGDTVPYVVCEKKSNPQNFNGLPSTQRAFHPDELPADEDLQIDFKYYLSQQIHPVVTRLVEPIDGTDASIIAEMLGIESSNIRIQPKKEDPAEALLGLGETRYDGCKGLVIKCPNGVCGKDIEIRKVFTETEKKIGSKELNLKLSLSTCHHCDHDLAVDIDGRNHTLMANHLKASCRKLVTKFYEGWMTCEDPVCGYKTKLSTGPMTKKGPRCPECNNAVLYLDFTEAQLFLQFSFYEFLLNLNDAETRPTEDSVRAHVKTLTSKYKTLCEKLKIVVLGFKNSMAYNQVDIGYLFKKQVFRSMRVG
jgi:DNA polymerase alpha subunit A